MVRYWLRPTASPSSFFSLQVVLLKMATNRELVLISQFVNGSLLKILEKIITFACKDTPPSSAPAIIVNVCLLDAVALKSLLMPIFNKMHLLQAA